MEGCCALHFGPPQVILRVTVLQALSPVNLTRFRYRLRVVCFGSVGMKQRRSRPWVASRSSPNISRQRVYSPPGWRDVLWLGVAIGPTPPATSWAQRSSRSSTATRGMPMSPRCAEDCGQPDVVGDEAGVVSEDTVRRALRRMEADAARSWQQEHLVRSMAPLLERPWFLDVDVTIKPLYGNQEGAKLGYNPAKPARPSHTYHTYLMGSTRLVLDVEVLPGDEHTPASTRPGLWHFLEKLPGSAWPQLLRGDCSFGSEAMMAWPEMRGLGYLFKLRKSQNVTRLIEEMDASNDGWVDAGQGWFGSGIDAAIVGMDSCPTCRHLAPAGVPAPHARPPTAERSQPAAAEAGVDGAGAPDLRVPGLGHQPRS